MLTQSSLLQFSRTAADVYKASAHHIMGCEWLTVNKEGKGAVMSTGPGSAPSPPDFLLMSLGACTGYGVKFLLDKQAKKFTKLDVDVEGEWTNEPERRFGNIKLLVKTDADIEESKLKAIVKMVEDKMCPVGLTLKYPPKIVAEVKIAK